VQASLAEVGVAVAEAQQALGEIDAESAYAQAEVVLRSPDVVAAAESLGVGAILDAVPAPSPCWQQSPTGLQDVWVCDPRRYSVPV
jgi:hypothetical protein